MDIERCFVDVFSKVADFPVFKRSIVLSLVLMFSTFSVFLRLCYVSPNIFVFLEFCKMARAGKNVSEANSRRKISVFLTRTFVINGDFLTKSTYAKVKVLK